MKKETFVIRLNKGEPDSIISKGVFDTLIHRFLPAISLTYIAAILGIATGKHDFYRYMFEERTAYIMSLFIMLWCAGPAIVWVFLNGSIMFRHVADIWYQFLSVMMVLLLGVGFVLFPEASIYGIGQYFALSIPIFIVNYLVVVKGWVPSSAAHPINALGLCALLFGASLNVIS